MQHLENIKERHQPNILKKQFHSKIKKKQKNVKDHVLESIIKQVKIIEIRKGSRFDMYSFVLKRTFP